VQSWTSIRTAQFCLYAIAGSVFLLLNAFGYAQDSIPSVAGSVSTIHVSSQFVILDAQVENKQTHALVGSAIFAYSRMEFRRKSLTSARTGCHFRWCSCSI